MAEVFNIDPRRVGESEWLPLVRKFVATAEQAGDVVSLQSRTEYLTPEAAGQRLGMSRSTVLRAIEAGELKSTKVGNRHRIPVREVERFNDRLVGDMAEVASTDSERPGPTFAAITTLRVGGPIGNLVTAESADDLVDAACDAEALIVGGGSNLLVGDEGFEGTVVLVRTRGVDIDGDRVTVAAGENWDDFVAAMLAAGRGQLAPLSGIPGSIGATPIQNVGAYGADVSQVIDRVAVYDRRQGCVREITSAACRFGYRTSVFKNSRRFVVVSATFLLPVVRTVSVVYPQLAAALEVPVGHEAAAGDVREAVLRLRRSKGMVLDDGDHDTWSAGSFFVNPVLTEVPAALSDCPSWPDPAGHKLSAAWLIEQAGFGRGFTIPGGTGRASLSGKHTLALTNRGGASAAEILELAATIRDGVQKKFNVILEPEPQLVGIRMPR